MTRLCVIRADASPLIGGGHVARCVTLADRLHERGWQLALAATDETMVTMGNLLPDWMIRQTLPPASFDDPHALMSAFPGGCDLVIVDHYRLDVVFESALRGWAGRIAVIDDLANRRHDADVLLDQTLGRRPDCYRPLVPSACIILTGTPYALLRREFAAARFAGLRPAADRIPPHHILISMGMGDPDGLSCRALDAIVSSGFPVDVRVVIGGCSPSLPQLKAQAEAAGNIQVLVDHQNMADTLAWADLAIGALGTTSWERCCMGVPTVAIVLADNQHEVARALSAAGAVEIVGQPSISDMSAVFQHLMKAPDRLAAMATKAIRICDGLGAARTAIHLEPELSSRGESITLRPYTADDEDVVFVWQSTEGMRRFSRNPEIPTREEHAAWCRSRLKNARSVTEIIQVGGQSAGMVRLDWCEPESAFEVSIMVAPDWQGHGIATAGLRLLRRLKADGRMIAEIHPDNHASRRAFANAGFLPGGHWLVNDSVARGL